MRASGPSPFNGTPLLIFVSKWLTNFALIGYSLVAFDCFRVGLLFHFLNTQLFHLLNYANHLAMSSKVISQTACAGIYFWWRRPNLGYFSMHPLDFLVLKLHSLNLKQLLILSVYRNLPWSMKQSLNDISHLTL